jgi:small subunit ribosomal protein S1
MSNDVNDPSQLPDSPESEEKSRRRILIGSQKDPDAYRPKRPRDWKPVGGEQPATPAPSPASVAAPPAPEVAAPAPPAAPVEVAPPVVDAPPAPLADTPAPVAPAPLRAATMPDLDSPLPEADLADELDVEVIEQEKPAVPRGGSGKRTVPLPNLRQRQAELEQELDQLMDGASLDDLIASSETVTQQPSLEPESQHTGRVVAIRRGDVFIELGGREQGVIPQRLMPEPPEVGKTLTVVVQRFNPEEGLYDLSIPNTAAAVADWGDLSQGMIVEAKITAHNTGGLECEVNHIRGFIPVSQIALYRVENLEEFVGQQFTCLVTEADPRRRNLVLSRRALLEREKEEARQRIFESLAVGQVHDGVVRKIMDFGAFVDIGGVDGLLHVSQLSWARVKHPSDVLQEGQAVRVRVNKIDPVTNKISFGYREMMENPWTQAAAKYPVNSVVKGTVTKIMEFGAFVQLEPGIEGLVHISELSNKRVWRATDVVQPDQEIEAIVLAVDAEAQRISLSMKLLAKRAEPEKKAEPEPAEAAPAPRAVRSKPVAPLKGGVGRSAGGDHFGLKW